VKRNSCPCKPLSQWPALCSPEDVCSLNDRTLCERFCSFNTEPFQITMPTPFHFEHSYQSLGDEFFERRSPEPVVDPRIVLFNDALAESLGLSANGMNAVDWAGFLSGQKLPPGAQPIAQAYAGHQFGGFTFLGDGRAILLGEQITASGQRFDIQLKGAGRSRYSRRGDGRATLRAMLREYLISEAMHYLGIPTTRSLAVVATGLPVWRERAHQGAVLTRIASSHIRVGTFEFVRHSLDTAALQRLVDYTIDRHYPELADAPNRSLALLNAVMERQLDLIVHWMRVGFIHGVMNTDNMSIAGETIDYGPCSFMNAYYPGTVFSSIDHQGRYAYANQPPVAQWNLAVLAETLLPLIDPDEKVAVGKAQELLHTFSGRYISKWLRMMTSRIGLVEVQPDDRSLVDDLLNWMQSVQADFTNTFLALETPGLLTSLHPNDLILTKWVERWEKRVEGQPGSIKAASARMSKMNPARIPRNHLVEEALDLAEKGDMSALEALMRELSDPFGSRAFPFQTVPAGFCSGYQTFCGT